MGSVTECHKSLDTFQWGLKLESQLELHLVCLVPKCSIETFYQVLPTKVHIRVCTRMHSAWCSMKDALYKRNLNIFCLILSTTLYLIYSPYTRWMIQKIHLDIKKLNIFIKFIIFQFLLFWRMESFIWVVRTWY